MCSAVTPLSIHSAALCRQSLFAMRSLSRAHSGYVYFALESPSLVRPKPVSQFLWIAAELRGITPGILYVHSGIHLHRLVACSKVCTYSVLVYRFHLGASQFLILSLSCWTSRTQPRVRAYPLACDLSTIKCLNSICEIDVIGDVEV